MACSDCAVCSRPINVPQDGMVYYISPGPQDTARVTIHAWCAADLIDNGRAYRVSPFAVRCANREPMADTLDY